MLQSWLCVVVGGCGFFFFFPPSSWQPAKYSQLQYNLIAGEMSQLSNALAMDEDFLRRGISASSCFFSPVCIFGRIYKLHQRGNETQQVTVQTRAAGCISLKRTKHHSDTRRGFSAAEITHCIVRNKAAQVIYSY